MTVLHDAALYGHASCVESLLKAGADASLKNEVSDGAEGQGERRCGVGARRGAGVGEGALCRRRAASPRRLSAPPCSRPLPPGRPPPLRLHFACTPPSLLFPSQWKQTALDLAKQENYTEIVTLLLAPPLTATV